MLSEVFFRYEFQNVRQFQNYMNIAVSGNIVAKSWMYTLCHKYVGVWVRSVIAHLKATLIFTYLISRQIHTNAECLYWISNAKINWKLIQYAGRHTHTYTHSHQMRQYHFDIIFEISNWYVFFTAHLW